VSKVLITGGAGFIGSKVAELLLKQGRDVVILDDFNDYYDPSFKRENVSRLSKSGIVQVVEGDIRNETLVRQLFENERFEAVVHLAARAGVRPSIQEPLLYTEVNEVGTIILLEAARHTGCNVFIFGSSSSVYGTNSKVPFSEEDPITQPVSPYAATKRAGELVCHTYHHLFQMNITCLRFFTVYGPRQRPEMAIYKFAEKMLSGKSVPRYGDGSSARDYTYIDDIARGVVMSVEAALPWQILNLGGNRTTTLSELIELIGRSAGVTPEIEALPDQPGDVPITYAEVGLAKKVLGWAPTIEIEEGIDRFVDWFKNERFLRSELTKR
jgi:UDP-glucuronate 4-epimerase